MQICLSIKLRKQIENNMVFGSMRTNVKVTHSSILLEISKTQFRLVTNLDTGHNTLGNLMVRLRILDHGSCR